jgi:Cd2+/Zn2+-exporting ATPase
VEITFKLTIRFTDTDCNVSSEVCFDYTPTQWVDFGIHFIAFVLAGRKVLDLAFRKAKRGDIFNEFVLMSVATIGAFYIGSYSEGVAVM